MSDDNPDFSGVWLIGSSPYPQKPEAHSWAQEISDERAASRGRNHPHTQCLPGDAPTPFGGGSPFISKIVQKPELMVVLLEDLHIVERFTRSEYGRMMVEVTIEDPTVFKKPWVQNVPFDLAPQEELFEYVCENNKWAQAAED